MKRIGGAALALACATALAGPAMAEGWVVLDLGEVENREICMDRADQVLRAYMEDHGAHSVEGDSWTKYGYDLEPGDNDVVIMCPVVGEDRVNAFLAVYGAFEDSAEDHTDQVSAELTRLWDEQSASSRSSAAARASEELDRALSALSEAQAAVSAAQEALRTALSSGEAQEGEAEPGEGDDWTEGDDEVIDLDEVLGPLKQELREGEGAETPAGENPEEAAPAEDEDSVPEDLEEEEDIAPVDPR